MNLAFVFPGQGSQSVGMLDGYKDNPIVKHTIEESSDVLGINFNKIIYGNDKELLDSTVNTQPILLSISIAIWRVYCSQNGKVPTMLAGHSLGEYTALTAAGVLKFDQALKLVSFRAKAMQNAVPAGLGGMAAIIGINSKIVTKICNDSSKKNVSVVPANFNSRDQTVVSGFSELIDEVCEQAKKAGARRAVKLSVSAPFHSPLMLPASEKLQNRLSNEEFLYPKIDVVNNVDVEIQNNPEDIKISLAKQAMSPVRWYEIIQKFHECFIDVIVECGPGKVLTGLTKRICPEIKTHSFSDEKSIEEFVMNLKELE